MNNSTQNQLVPVNKLRLPPGVDTSGMSEEDIQALAEIYAQEMQATTEGISVRPMRWKINKDTMTFVNSLGQSVDELRGVVVYAQKNRGFWPHGRDSKIPVCSSTDCVTGNPTQEGIEKYGLSPNQACADCPFNKFGTAVSQDGSKGRGKACKEMRRIFLSEDPNLVPSFVSLPPTSITVWDEYISARGTQGIPNVGAEAVFTLVEGQSGGYTVAKLKPKLGNRIPPTEWAGFIRQRDPMREFAESIGVTDDDYDEGDEAAGGRSASAQGDDPF